MARASAAVRAPSQSRSASREQPAGESPAVACSTIRTSTAVIAPSQLTSPRKGAVGADDDTGPEAVGGAGVAVGVGVTAIVVGGVAVGVMVGACGGS